MQCASCQTKEPSSKLILMAKEILVMIRDHQKDITIVNKYAPNIQPLGYIKQILTNLKGEIGINTQTSGSSALHSQLQMEYIDKKSISINSKYCGPNGSSIQNGPHIRTCGTVHPADTYGIVHPTTANTFSSQMYMEHSLRLITGQVTSLYTLKAIEIILNISLLTTE